MSTYRHILVIDDDEELCNTIRDFLDSIGYSTDCVTDGDTALKKMGEQKTDLAVVDILMPEKDGVDTIMDIDKNFPDVKIVAISGGGPFDRTELLSMAEVLGADAVMAKPFDFQDLQDTIESILGNGNQEKQA